MAPSPLSLAASKAASKFKTRCAQFGFEDVAQLDDGTLLADRVRHHRQHRGRRSAISARVKNAVG